MYDVADLVAVSTKMSRGRSELAAELRSFATNTPYVIYYELAPNGIVIVRILITLVISTLYF